MGLSSGGFTLPEGAARLVHLTYPPLYGTGRTDNASSGTGFSVRVGSGSSGIALSAAGGGTVTTFARGDNSVPVFIKTTAAAADVAQIQIGAAMFPLMEALSANVPDVPCLVYRLIAVCAFDVLPAPLGVNQDLGMEILPGNVANMNVPTPGRPGCMFGPTDVGKFGLRIRKLFSGAYTLDRQLTFAQAGIVNVADYNIYELRIIGSSKGVGAKLKAFVNGQQFGADVDISNAAGIFPVLSQAGGGFNGYNWRLTNGNVGNQIGAPYTWYCNEVHWIISPTADTSG